MALRMRNGITSQATSNQENVAGIGKAKTLATTGLPTRAALGEIGNVQTRQMAKTGKDAIPAKKNDVLKPTTSIAIKKQTLVSGAGLKNVTASTTTTTAKVTTQKSTTQSLICKTSTLIKPSRAVIKPAATTVTSATSTAASIRPNIQIKPRPRPVGTLLKTTTSSSSLLSTGSLLIQKPFAPTHITVPKIPENSGIKDIDKESTGNPILLGEYAGEIYAFLKEMELKFLVEDDFLKGQQVNSKMRALVVDWLVDVQLQYSLLLETLHLAIGIFDRFLNKHRIIGRQELQLVGVTSMWIASKYEELFSPELENFVYITDRAYTKKKILEMEELIHKTLDFCYGQPLSIHFLRRYSNAAEADAKLHTYAKYFLELALITYSLRSVRPSLIAAVALYIGLCVVGNHGEPGKSIWSDCLQFYTTYSYDDIEPYVPVLARAILEAKSSKLQAVQRKYSGNKVYRVSSIVYLQSNVLEELARIESGKVKP